MAFGSGSFYRNRALRRAGLAAGMIALDVATGTGLVAREAIARDPLANRPRAQRHERTERRRLFRFLG